MSVQYRHSITTGIGTNTYDEAHRLVLEVFKTLRFPVTLVHGDGFHPKWGDEPVLTAWWVEPKKLRWTAIPLYIKSVLEQSYVFYTIEQVEVVD